MNRELVPIGNRDERARFIARRFARYLTGRVLDVGCDRARLRQLVPGLDYVGIDVGGTPDLVVNLERERIPFPDREFDCVVCSDVLEHLDNLHQNFAELVRVARGHLVISLPNNYANARRPVARGRGTLGHYGLPAEPPEDRHKWFFSLGEAADFFRGQVGRHPVELVELFCVERPRPLLVRVVRGLLYARVAYLNRYAHSAWAVYRRAG